MADHHPHLGKQPAKLKTRQLPPYELLKALAGPRRRSCIPDPKSAAHDRPPREPRGARAPRASAAAHAPRGQAGRGRRGGRARTVPACPWRCAAAPGADRRGARPAASPSSTRPLPRVRCGCTSPRSRACLRLARLPWRRAGLRPRPAPAPGSPRSRASAGPRARSHLPRRALGPGSRGRMPVLACSPAFGESSAEWYF